MVTTSRREKYRYFEEVNEAFESSDNKGHVSKGVWFILYGCGLL